MNFARRLEALAAPDLEILLSRRPEVAALAGRADPGWAELAATLALPRHVALTLMRIDRFLSQVLQLGCIEGGRLTAAVAGREGLGRADLDAAVSELQRWGLAFSDGAGGVAVPPAVANMVWNPGGLGTSVARLLENVTVDDMRSIAMLLGLHGPMLPKRKRELADAVGARLADSGAMGEILRAAPPAARADLDTLRRAGGSTRGARLRGAWQRHYSWSSMRWDPRGAEDGPGWLLAHGIVLPEDDSQVSMALPAEVERALRGRVFARWDVSAPALELAPLREEKHPVELVIAMDSLLEAWRHASPPALKGGGAPKREIKRAAQTIGWSEEETERLIELGVAAGLLRERELVPEKRNRSRRAPRVLQSRRAVIETNGQIGWWLGRSEAARWLELAHVWLESLGATGEHGFEPVREKLVLQLLGELETGQGATAATIGNVLAWRYPALFADAATGAALALSVGRAVASLCAGGAPTVIGLNNAGRLAFLSSGSVDLEALKRAFPPPADRCLVTADHRVVVSGLPSGELAQMLVRIAEVVSVQPARVYRLTETSLGRALDGGLTAAEILRVLRGHASSEIPRNVVALVEDVARRHGRLRVGTADVYVVADDPAHLELVARDRAVGGSRLRRLSPTVAVIDGRERDEVMAALRRAGLMPVTDRAAEPQASAASPARPVRSSPSPRRARTRTEPGALDAAAAARLAAAL
ncbi:MAG: helicase-associated domain-containing protein, partial [Thermoleophilaceae bacterium]